jgi:hypothetical protein
LLLRIVGGNTAEYPKTVFLDLLGILPTDFMAAIALVRKIPVRSELYKEAQAKAQSWQKDFAQTIR